MFSRKTRTRYRSSASTIPARHGLRGDKAAPGAQRRSSHARTLATLQARSLKLSFQKWFYYRTMLKLPIVRMAHGKHLEIGAEAVEGLASGNAGRLDVRPLLNHTSKFRTSRAYFSINSRR